jgi:hypothetical protein
MYHTVSYSKTKTWKNNQETELFVQPLTLQIDAVYKDT